MSTSATPRLHAVQCLSPMGLHTMAYKEWGAPDNPEVLICVHGVTRISDDFDALAAALCDRYRVICPDVVGRGRSSRLTDPRFYAVPQYVSDMMTLIARSGAAKVDWLGTSMGGLIGMTLASLKDTPIRKLILNDIGPALDPAALARIAAYMGQELSFENREEAIKHILNIAAPFGPHSDEEWQKLAGDVLVQRRDRTWTTHYDPAIATSFLSFTQQAQQASEAALWAMYNAISCPTLLLRGAESDLLSARTAAVMTRCGPHALLKEFSGIGHAPTLMHPDQIAIVRDFLLGTGPA
jgi:pimeloyl-ACP methyl ester carboxylesterase